MPDRRTRAWPCAAGLLCGLLLTASTACGPAAGERRTAERKPAADAEWTWLLRAKRTLDGQRAKLAAGAANDAGLAKRSEALAAELNRRLADFINADPPVQGGPLTVRQQAAIRMKSDEDIRLARRLVAQAGDFQRAIDIYEEALVVDPGNPRLREELAKARARRYVRREIFAQVEEGMDQEQVRSLLGQPNLHSVRDYPSRNVVGWFYPKDDSGAAAAVWFHNDGGRYAVYLCDFDALPPRRPGAAPAETSAMQRGAT
jgi:tetratricopeptide (TPR) repeat protein